MSNWFRRVCYLEVFPKENSSCSRQVCNSAFPISFLCLHLDVTGLPCATSAQRSMITCTKPAVMRSGKCGSNQSPSTGDMWVPCGLAMFPSALSPTCCTWHACGDVCNNYCRLGLSVACTTSGVHMQLHPLTQWARWLMVQTKPNMACHTLPRMTSQRRMVSSTRWVVSVCVCVDRQDCMLPLCMGSLPMRTCSQGTCPVGQMPLWKLCTGTSWLLAGRCTL